MLHPMTRALLLCLALTACTRFPAVIAAFDPNAETPALLPTAELPSGRDADIGDPLASRTAALRARAADLRAN